MGMKNLTCEALVITAIIAILVGSAMGEEGDYFKISIMSMFKPVVMDILPDEDEPFVLNIDGESCDEYIATRKDHFNIYLTGDNFIIRVIDDNMAVIREKKAGLKSVISFMARDTKRPYLKFIITANGKATKSYKGVLEVRHLYKDFLVLLSVRREELIAAVAEPEMHRYSSHEARKVQVILARSYLYANKTRHEISGYNFCDTSHCQFVKETESGSPDVMAVVRETRGEVVTFGGAVVSPFYFDTCGGYTAYPSTIWGAIDSRYPYLVPVKCDYCSDSEYYRYERVIEKSRLSQVFLGRQDDSFTIKVTKRDGNDHWVETVNIKGNGIDSTIKGDRFRSLVCGAFGQDMLPSASFAVTLDGGRYIFNGKGRGHGVGLCQSGADKMADLGFKYKDIIKFYFTGVMVERIR